MVRMYPEYSKMDAIMGIEQEEKPERFSPKMKKKGQTGESDTAGCGKG